jgi:methyl-accepting chemotaxis protein
MALVPRLNRPRQAVTLTISRRLGILVGLAALVLVSVICLQLLALRDSLADERRSGLKMQVEQASSMVEALASAATKGAMTREAAQKQAKDTLRSMKFGRDSYFLVYSYDGITLVNQSRPDAEGTNRLNAVDPNGKHHIAAMIDAAKSGVGYADYASTRAGSDKAMPKLSYQVGFAPWGWMIGTSLFVDDLDDLFWREALTTIAWTTPLLVILIGAAWWLSRGLVRPSAC